MLVGPSKHSAHIAWEAEQSTNESMIIAADMRSLSVIDKQ